MTQDLTAAVERVRAFLDVWGADPIVRQSRAELHAADLFALLDALDGFGIPAIEPDDTVTEAAEWTDYDPEC